MILRYILVILGIYFVYKVVFEFIVPVFRTTQKIRRQFGDMQQHMQDQVNATQQGFSNRQQQPSSPAPEQQKARSGDYIDFEEVK